MSVLKTGTSRQPQQLVKTEKHCSVEGCAKPVIGRGMCEAHYRKFIKYGSVESPFGYGERKNHPLYETWRYQLKIKEGRCATWEDFWQFVADVGEKPSEKHQLRRHDVRKPWSIENFYWKETTNSTENYAKYQREWRQQNSLKAKGYDLKRHFGIELSEYLKMYNDQKGCCAICGTHKNSYTQTLTKGGEGGRNTLIVDHNHTTGTVRKLLCHQCNKGIGALQDSVEILKKAVKYLTQHAE